MAFPSDLKRTTFQVLCRVGVDHFVRRRGGNHLLIVGYHGVVRDEDDAIKSWLMLPAGQFEKQIEYLKTHYDVIPMSEAAIRIREHRPFERPTACITFDDGYKNNQTVAGPILERHQVPATIYLATGFIGSSKIHWTIRLERALATSSVPYLDLSDIGLRTYSLQNLRSQTFVRLVSRLYRLPYEQQQEVVHRTLDRLGERENEDYAAFQMLTWNDARQFEQNNLIEFGGHTIHHQTVRPLDDDQLEEEVGGSIEEVARQVRHVTNTFAYPNGTPNDFDERAEEVLKRHGIIAALSTIDGLNHSDAPPYALRRITVGSHVSLDEFRLRVSGTVDTVKGWVSNGHDQHVWSY